MEILAKRKLRKERTLKKTKLYLMVAVVFISFVYLSFEILKLKLVHGEEYEMNAITQLVYNSVSSEQSIKPVRGSIVDKNMVNLAISKPIYDVFIDVRVIVYVDPFVRSDSLSKLNQVLGIPITKLYSYLEIEDIEYDEKGNISKITPANDTNHLVIAKGLSYEKAMELEALKPKYVYLESDSKRTYLYNNLCANVIGFIRGDVRTGLEQYYDKYLSGVPGRIFRVYTEEGSVATEKIDAKPGGTLVTTIDIGIQQIAEDAVKKYGEMEDAENTSVIVMNPKTGEITAMAEYPSFDLNNPVSLDGITKASYKELWKDLPEDELFNKLNRIWTSYNVTDTFEPGSTFKPVTVAAALEENIITTESTFSCPGSKWVGGYSINCHKRSGHGTQNVEQSLYNSCNVAMMNISEKCGRDIFYKYQRDFGFGEKTGIDLPAEIGAEGLLHRLENLGSSELATSSFGQRFNATPIQIISAFSAVINGGNLMKPHVVSRIIDEKGAVVLENTPVIQRKVISEETSDYLRTAMESVISVGTGKKAEIPGWAIGGKTGTGEQGIAGTANYHYTLSIITYFPVENPEYVAMVIINRPGNYADGVTSPGPMMKEVMQNIIKYKSIPPSYDESGNASVISQSDISSVGDYVGKTIDEVTQDLNGLSLEYELIGGGGTVVSAQFPKPGTNIPKGSTVILNIEYGDTKYDMVRIPKLVSLTKEQAIETLTTLKLVPIVEVIEEEPPDVSVEEEPSETPFEAESSEEPRPSETKYYVIEQIPKQDGIQVMEGTQIKIKVKVGARN